MPDRCGMMYDCATLARKDGIVDPSRSSEPEDPASHLVDAHVGRYPAYERCPQKTPLCVSSDFRLYYDNQDSTDELLVLHRLDSDYWGPLSVNDGGHGVPASRIGGLPQSFRQEVHDYTRRAKETIGGRPPPGRRGQGRHHHCPSRDLPPMDT